MAQTTGDQDKICSDGSFRGSEATRRPPSAGFHCSETTGTNDKDGVMFCCTVSNMHHDQVVSMRTRSGNRMNNRRRLRKLQQHKKDESDKNDDDEEEATVKNCSSFIFRCREPSFGVLTNNEPTTSTAALSATDVEEGEKDDNEKDNDNDDDKYNNFFLIGTAETYPYALAKRTGFQIWPGTRILVDALLLPSPGDHPRLQYWQQALLKDKPGLNILELGAGVGVVGTLLAGVAGAQVLLTDLESVVNDSLIPNLIDQQNATDSIPCSRSPPLLWLQDQSSSAVPIGDGWAAAAPLDWNQPLTPQLSIEQQQQIDLIIAGDCAFMSSMLKGLFDTVSAIFEASNRATTKKQPPRLLLSLQRRDPEFFTSIDYLLSEITTRSWAFECLCWYPVVKEVEVAEREESNRCNNSTDGSTSSSSDAMKEVFLFEVSPPATMP